MKTSFTSPLRWLWLCAILALTGCFGDDDDNDNGNSQATISGTAATGAAMSGTVTAVGANGAQANATLGSGGAYTLIVDGLTFPLLIKADDGAGTVLYSWADAAGDTANITPLTTLALVFTDLPDNLNEVFANWAASATQLNAAAMRAAQAKVNANLQSQFTSEGVDSASYDFLTAAFTANGSGIDGVLDGLQFNFDYLGADLDAVVSITLADGTTPVTFSIDIDTSGVTIGGGGTGGGSCASGWCLTVSGTVTTSGVAVNVPAVTVSGLSEGEVPAASDSGNIEQSINDAYGATGTISNLQWNIVSASASQVVAHLTFDVAITSPVAMTAHYDLTYTYTKASDTTSGGGGNGGNTGGGGAVLTCDTSQYVAGSVSAPTPAILADYAGTYTATEYTDNGLPPPDYLETVVGTATLVLNADGTATYNGDALPLVSVCEGVFIAPHRGMYLLSSGMTHFDLVDDGSLYGYTADGYSVRP